MAKHLCSCGKIAQWIYIPSGDDKYWCDDCISSPDDKGCSCNWCDYESEKPHGEENKDWRFIPSYKEQTTWEYLDEKGRPYPCCEYEYVENGFDIKVKLFLTDEQKEWIRNIPQDISWCKCDIYLKDGTCLEEKWITDQSYFWIIEDLNISNKDIVKIVKNEKIS